MGTQNHTRVSHEDPELSRMVTQMVNEMGVMYLDKQDRRFVFFSDGWWAIKMGDYRIRNWGGNKGKRGRSEWTEKTKNGGLLPTPGPVKEVSW